MFDKYKILHSLYFNKLARIFINYLFKNKYINNYNINIFYPILLPRNDSVLLINILNNFLFLKNLTTCLELGFGSGFFNNVFKCNNMKFIFISFDKKYLCFINSKINCKNLYTFCCSWTYFLFNIKKYNIIFSNPPYLSIENFNFYFKKNEKTKYSLSSNNYGLYDIFIIICFCYYILILNGVLILEHGYNQSKLIRNLMKLIGFINIYTFKDYNYLCRVTYSEK